MDSEASAEAALEAEAQAVAGKYKSLALMKKVLLLLLISGFYSGYSQGWQNICMPGHTIFNEASGELIVFRNDTSYLSGTDSVFLSFPTIKLFSQPACLDTNGGSILGRTIHKKPSGTFTFFNFWNDTIVLHTLAGLNSPWRFARLSDTSYMQASVTAITVQTHLGISDSVKEISLQAKNNFNQPINHLLNNTILKLGKTLGFIQVINLNDFPVNPVIYTLAGKESGMPGIQVITPEMVYDFDPSDEFHYQGNMTSIHYFENHKEIQTILAKEVLSPGLIMYTVHSCSLRIAHSHPFYYPDTTRIESVYDVTYRMDSLSALRHFCASPGEFIPYPISTSNWLADRFFWDYEDEYNQRPTRSYTGSTYFPSSAACWISTVGFNYQYAPGLGETKRWIDAGGGLGSVHSLVYFKKGTEEWGLPVAESCSILLGEAEVPAPETIIYPNPVTGKAEIHLPDRSFTLPVTLFVYSLSGQMIRRETIHTPTYIWERDRIKAGMYLMILQDAKKMILSEFKVILSD